MTDRFSGFLFNVGWGIVRRLPESWAQSLFQWGARRLYRKDDRGVQRLRATLKRVTGASGFILESHVRSGLESYARYWQETFRLPVWSPERLHASVKIDGFEKLTQVVNEGKGAVVALPHSANWDLAGAWACLNGLRFSTVAERLKPEALFRRFVAHRQSLGMDVIPLSRGERPPLEVLTERLKQRGVVVLLADRDMSAKGVPVSFFGAQATMPAGPALLSLTTGAPLFTASLWYEPEILRVRIEEMPSAPDLEQAGQISWLCQQIATRFEESIATHPADWHMLQKIWPDDEPLRRT